MKYCKSGISIFLARICLILVLKFANFHMTLHLSGESNSLNIWLVAELFSDTVKLFLFTEHSLITRCDVSFRVSIIYICISYIYIYNYVLIYSNILSWKLIEKYIPPFLGMQDGLEQSMSVDWDRRRRFKFPRGQMFFFQWCSRTKYCYIYIYIYIYIIYWSAFAFLSEWSGFDKHCDLTLYGPNSFFRRFSGHSLR